MVQYQRREAGCSGSQTEVSCSPLLDIWVTSFILLLFSLTFSFSCINCHHAFKDIKAIEEKYRGKPVEFIGIHSHKFPEEKDSNSLRNAIQKLSVEHPVLNDTDKVLWEKMNIEAWPTVILLNPDGNELFRVRFAYGIDAFVWLI